jgi:hypothetical protein
MKIPSILQHAIRSATDLFRAKTPRHQPWIGLEHIEDRILLSVTVHAATWDQHGGSTDWNTATNWKYDDPADQYHNAPVVPSNDNNTLDWFYVAINDSSAAGATPTRFPLSLLLLLIIPFLLLLHLLPPPLSTLKCEI